MYVKGNAANFDGQRLHIAPMFRRKKEVTTPNLIGTLPPELRNRIYELHLVDVEVATRKLGRRYVKAYDVLHEPPLMRVSKQLRGEFGIMFYGRQHFNITNGLRGLTISSNLDKIRSAVAICGPKPFASFSVRPGSSAWRTLEDLLPLLELMRTTGFEPALKEYEPQAGKYDSIFVNAGKSSGLQRALERALSIGRRARNERWDQERLTAHFNAWAKNASKTASRTSRTDTKKKKKL